MAKMTLVKTEREEERKREMGYDSLLLTSCSPDQVQRDCNKISCSRVWHIGVHDENYSPTYIFGHGRASPCSAISASATENNNDDFFFFFFFFFFSPKVNVEYPASFRTTS